MNKNNKLIALAVIIILLLGVAFLVKMNQDQKESRSKAAGEFVELTFSPSSTTVSQNTEFSVKLLLDTNTLAVNGVDISIPIDKSKINFVSFTPSQALNTPVINNYDIEQGLFRYTVVDTTTSQINGVIELGTLNLTAVSNGKGTLTVNKSQITANGLEYSIPLQIPSPFKYSVNNKRK